MLTFVSAFAIGYLEVFVFSSLRQQTAVLKFHLDVDYTATHIDSVLGRPTCLSADLCFTAILSLFFAL